MASPVVCPSCSALVPAPVGAGGPPGKCPACGATLPPVAVPEPTRAAVSRPTGPPRKSHLGLLLAALFGIGLLTCAGLGFGGYWVYTMVREQLREKPEETNDRVTLKNYEKLRLYLTTRAQAEEILGPGRQATPDDLRKHFPPTNQRQQEWGPKVDQGRALVWVNGKVYILVAFHPDAGPAARAQMKYMDLGGTSTSEGHPNDEMFAKEVSRAEQRKKWAEVAALPPIEVTAAELARAYRDDPAAANAKYEGRWVIVEGEVSAVHPTGGYLKGTPPDTRDKFGRRVECWSAADAADQIWMLSRGQHVKVKGYCPSGGADRPEAVLRNAVVVYAGPDPSIKIGADDLAREYAADPKATDAKYKGKELTLSDAVVTGRQGEAALFLTGGGKGAALEIKATFAPGYKPKVADLRPGDRIRVKGEYAGSAGGTVTLTEARLMP